MSLNTIIDLTKDPINGQPMRDPIGKESPLPMEMALDIFKNLKQDLRSVALVCRKMRQ